MAYKKVIEIVIVAPDEEAAGVLEAGMIDAAINLSNSEPGHVTVMEPHIEQEVEDSECDDQTWEARAEELGFELTQSVDEHGTPIEVWMRNGEGPQFHSVEDAVRSVEGSA